MVDMKGGSYLVVCKFHRNSGNRTYINYMALVSVIGTIDRILHVSPIVNDCIDWSVSIKQTGVYPWEIEITSDAPDADEGYIAIYRLV